MTDLSIPNTFSSGTSIVAADMNANFDAIETMVNTTGVPLVQDGSIGAAKVADDVTSQWRTIASRSGRAAAGVVGTDEFVITSDYADDVKAVTSAWSSSACFWFDPSDYAFVGKSLQLVIRAWCVTETDPTDSTLTVAMFRCTGTTSGAITARSSTDLTNTVSLSPNAANTIYSGVSSANAPSTAGLHFVSFDHSVAPVQAMTYGYSVHVRAQ